MAHTALTLEETREFQDSPQELEAKIEKLAVLIQNSSNFVVWTGAGISTSIGVPDFRSHDIGKWALQARGEQLDTTKFKQVSSISALPSLTHMALVTLLRSGHLKHIISSNTDAIHRRSGVHPNEIAELHGNSNKVRCSNCNLYCYADQRTRVAKHVHQHATGIACPRCGGGGSAIATATAAGTVPGQQVEGKKTRSNTTTTNVNTNVNTNTIPRGEMQDTIVNFGEYLEEAVATRASNFGAQADLLLVLGSSLRVITCDALEQIRQKKGGKLVIVNKQRTPYDKYCAVRIFANVDEVMRPLVETKLGQAILPWILHRFVKVRIGSLLASASTCGASTKLLVQGVDEVGDVFAWMTKVEIGTITAASPLLPSTTTRASSKILEQQQQQQECGAAASSTPSSKTTSTALTFTSFSSTTPSLPQGLFQPIMLECNRLPPSPIILRLHPSSHRQEPPCDILMDQILSPTTIIKSSSNDADNTSAAIASSTSDANKAKTEIEVKTNDCAVYTFHCQLDSRTNTWSSTLILPAKATAVTSSAGTAASSAKTATNVSKVPALS